MSKKSLFVLSFFIVLAFFIARDREKASLELEADKEVVFAEEVAEPGAKVEEPPSVSDITIGQKIPEEENQVSKGFKKCFPDKNSVSTLEGAKKELVKDLGESKGDPQTKIKSYTVLNREGGKEFVELTTHFTNEGKAFTILQRFGVAPDGLPESLRVEPEDRQNPSQKAIQRYLRRGELIEERSDMYQDFARGSIDYLIINGKVSSLKVSSRRNVFECMISAETESMECGCR